MPKLFSSTFFCALSIDFVIIECWITSPSSSPILSITLATLSDPNNLMRLSSSETKNCELPGSPCLPDLPLNCRSTLLESCLSVPIIAKPPDSLTISDSLISVPLPAILVAIVTIPGFPASATISASFLCNLAFRTLCFIFLVVKVLLNNSEISTDVVPISIGLPSFDSFVTSSITALYFSLFVLYIKSLSSFLTIGRFVGISMTSNL